MTMRRRKTSEKWKVPACRQAGLVESGKYRHTSIVASVSIVGALNVTPNSFHDGGQFMDMDAARQRGREMIADGAGIVEIGGESSLNAAAVSSDEELRRVIPVLRLLRADHPRASFSVDTSKSIVAEAAIREGVVMINDVSAGRADPRMFSVVAEGSVKCVLMYSKDIPPTSIGDRAYDDVIATIRDFLAERADAAINAGVAAERIILDPGLGFFLGTDPAYSFRVLARLKEFASLGFPLFVSPSRKSFLAGAEKLPPAERLPGTIAASAIAVLHGASYIRTHDVKEVRRGCDVALQTHNSQKPIHNL